MTTMEKIEKKKDILADYCRKNGISYLGVFGSVAKDEETRSSDIDFLVDLKINKSLLQFARIKLDLEKMFYREVDLAIRKNLKSRIKDEILNDVKELYNEPKK